MPISREEPCSIFYRIITFWVEYWLYFFHLGLLWINRMLYYEEKYLFRAWIRILQRYYLRSVVSLCWTFPSSSFFYCLAHQDQYHIYSFNWNMRILFTNLLLLFILLQSEGHSFACTIFIIFHMILFKVVTIANRGYYFMNAFLIILVLIIDVFIA